MIDPKEFRTWVIRPTLLNLERHSGMKGLHSEDAEALLLGTAVAESHLTHLKQIQGPALGFYQIEPATHTDLWINFLEYRRELRQGVNHFLMPALTREAQLVTNLAYATVIARLLYYRHSEPLPSKNDLRSMGNYWKRYYNTEHGAGTADGWVEAYRHFVLNAA